jgi:hypothetical protein
LRHKGFPSGITKLHYYNLIYRKTNSYSKDLWERGGLTPAESFCTPGTDFTSGKDSLYLHPQAVSDRARKPYSRCPHFLFVKSEICQKEKAAAGARLFKLARYWLGTISEIVFIM